MFISKCDELIAAAKRTAIKLSSQQLAFNLSAVLHTSLLIKNKKLRKDKLFHEFIRMRKKTMNRTNRDFVKRIS